MNILIVYEDLKFIQDERLTNVYRVLLKFTNQQSVNIRYANLNYNTQNISNMDIFNSRNAICQAFSEILDQIINCDLLIIIPSFEDYTHSVLRHFFEYASFLCMPHKELHKKLNHVTAVIASHNSFRDTNNWARSLIFMGVKNISDFNISFHFLSDENLISIRLHEIFKTINKSLIEDFNNTTLLKFYFSILNFKIKLYEKYILNFLKIMTLKTNLIKTS